MKKFVLVSALAFIVVCGLWTVDCVSAETAKEKGLVGYWNFDEGKGETAKDASGNNNGTVMDAKWVQGKIGGALQFDGEASMVEIQPSKVFNLSQLTIMCWIKTPEEFGNPQTWRCLMSMEEGGCGSAEGRDINYYAYSEDGAKVTHFHLSSPTKLGATMVPLAAPLEPNTWHHAAITIDAKGKHIYYIDGNDFGEQDGTPGTADGDYPVIIGKADNFWNGVIDELKIYNRALGPDEIKAQAARK